MQIFLVLDDDGAHQAGRFIDIALDRYARDHVAEFDLTALVGKNRHVVRIPLHERLALFDGRFLGFGNNRANNNIIALEFASFRVVHADRAVLVQDDPTAVEGLHSA